MLRPIATQLCSFIYLTLLFIVFMYKRKDHHFEGLIYQVLLLITMILVFLDMASIIFIINDFNILLTKILCKSYLVFSILWCFWLMVYVFSINSDKNYDSFKEVFHKESLYRFGIIITFILCIGPIVLTTKWEYLVNKTVAYQYGPALYYTYIVSFIYMAIMSIYMIYNPKKMSFLKRIPILSFLLLGLIAIVIQWVYNSILLVSAVMAFEMLFIYFTMENPDLKIINELEKDKEALDEASKAKTDFLSNMSHDIRTPMNAIIGFSESLLMEDMNEFQKGEVRNIYEAASTLLGIINNVLDVSRIESGKEEKNEKSYELRKVVMQLTSVITSKIDKNKIKFNVQIDNNVPDFLIGDELKIYQILMNLLSNAVKYTTEGHIDFKISSERLGEYVNLKFVVSDTGIGIKEEDYDKLFVKFSRIHNKENYEAIEGTGLGLVITKKLVELLGGQITFESVYKEGTSFTVIIPQKIDEVTANSQTAAGNNEKSNITNVHFDGSLYDILIVDDNNLNLKVAERILSDYHFKIQLANSGEECINRLRNGERYDMIFLDHMMPVMDGVQTLHEIRNIENIKIPPIIALTANAMVGMKEMYLNEGFDGYISKPINRDELQTLLNNFFCQK